MGGKLEDQTYQSHHSGRKTKVNEEPNTEAEEARSRDKVLDRDVGGLALEGVLLVVVAGVRHIANELGWVSGWLVS